jgi:ABC-2 type transport system permease protein
MIARSLNVFFQLLRRDLYAFLREYPAKLFDTAFMFTTSMIVFAYFMPQEWVDKSYAPFILIGAISSFGLIEIVGKVGLLMADIQGDRTISQTLILPVSSEAVFCYIGIFWALSSILLSVFLFPYGKLLIFDRFDLAKVSYIRLIPMYISANLFYGFFALWLASILKGIESINSLWMRAINPLWFFGAYFYSWEAALKLSPVIGYISLINPMVYIMEGMRAAALGQKGYLPYWICLVMVWVFIFACAIHAICRLKKRLDCV